MDRAQCLVLRGNALLMVKHRMDGVAWWCLPGGGVEAGETPRQAAIRELQEECCVDGTVLRELSVGYLPAFAVYTYLVDIGDQEPRLGTDPEFPGDEQVLVDVQWLTLAEIPERGRAFMWAAGLLGVKAFLDEVESWGDEISYPGKAQGHTPQK